MLDYFGKLNKNVIDQIKYRETIITGEIKTDNGDGTYGVEISQSGKTYPNVETAHYGDVFTVGEIAIITYEYGNKERPRLWGHAKKIAQEPKIVEVDFSGGARVETLNAYSITVTTAYVNGKISITGIIGDCIGRGFHYGTTTDYGKDVYEEDSFGEGTYNLQMTELTPGEIYHYQAYVKDANGDEQVGEDKIMTTIAGKIVVLSYNSEDGKNYLRLYGIDGNYLNKQVDSEGDFSGIYDLCMDADDNIYFVYSFGPAGAHECYIKKYDQNLNLLKTYDVFLNEGIQTNGFNFGSNGYLYTLDIDKASPYHRFIQKRSTTTLAVLDTMADLGSVNISGEPCFDTDGNFYLYYFVDDVVKKFNSSGTLIATSPSVPTMFARFGCGVIGNYVYFPKSTSVLYYFPLDLSSVIEWSPDYSHYGFTVKAGYIYGYNTSGYLSKYDSNRNLVWTKDIGGSGREIGSYQFK